MAALSGVVRDSTGAFASRLLRAYREDNGAFVGEYLSSSADGAWSITTTDTSKHFVVEHNSGGDYYWSNTGLYLPLSSNLNDVSGTTKTVTANGDAQFSSARSPFGGGSLLLDGTGDYLAITDHADLQAGTGACAFECFFYLSAYPASGNYFVLGSKYSSSTSRWSLYLGQSTTSDSGLRLAFGNTVVAGHSAQTATLASLGITTGSWYYAGWFRRSDGTVYVILNTDSLPLYSTNSSDISISGSAVQIGAQNASNLLNGNIAHARFTKGGKREFVKKPICPFPVGEYSPSENSMVYSNLTPV